MDELKGLSGFSAWSIYNKVAFNLVFLRKHTLKKRDFFSEIAEIISLDSEDAMRESLLNLCGTDLEMNISTEDCIVDFKKQDDDTRRLMLLESLNYSNISNDELLSLLALHKDANGIPYSKSNISNIPLDELMPLMIESLLLCSKVDVDLSIISKEEMLKLDGKRIDVNKQAGDILANNPDIGVADLLTLSIRKAFSKLAIGD